MLSLRTRAIIWDVLLVVAIITALVAIFYFGFVVGAKCAQCDAYNAAREFKPQVSQDYAANDAACIKYLFADNDLSAVKRRVCGKGAKQ